MSTQPEYKDSLFIAQDSRSNFKAIIAKRPDLTKFNAGRFAPSLVNTYQYAGLCIGFAATGGDAGFFKAYNSASTDGSQVPVGFLAEDAGIDASGNGSQISWISGGQLLQAALIGVDAGAITALKAKSYTENGVQILDF
jgi:hypothetical protein